VVRDGLDMGKEMAGKAAMDFMMWMEDLKKGKRI